jgi:acetate kinase
MRQRTIERLSVFGLKLDADANGQMFGGRCGVITAKDSKATAAVIATNEEWMISHDTLEAVAASTAA